MAILFIGPTRLGDGILASGLLAALHERHPGEEITLACGAPAALALRDAPGVVSLHIMEKQSRGRHWIELWRVARKRRWQRVVDLRRSALPWLLRADIRQSIPKGRPDEHRVALASRALGLPPQAPRPWLHAGHRAAAAHQLPPGRPVLALATGANWVCKTWPAMRFAELARRLTRKDGPLPNGVVLLVGGDAERKTAGAVTACLPPEDVIDTFGYDIASTAALLERADLFVGNDSAMMHLAAAAGTRTVGLFGPTRDEHYAPWGPNAIVVRTPESFAALQAMRDADARWRSQSQMEGLEVQAVEAAILSRWPCPDARHGV
ncbi:glycosyltransferase family 9 protein [Falsiroseomonas sp.]|uniref:glycosyltransferase family 9 protein n=1 Tax=Falsiroseomonas sp. TaxID=2870721 RepID=UPI00271D4C3D|nr:glycosyltransferase family 9 protein [Falsiroseomonas sp.]MDO9500069.1 glycosyltransferase family 9 protein [Falsiroseomonas sp.]